MPFSMYRPVMEELSVPAFPAEKVTENGVFALQVKFIVPDDMLEGILMDGPEATPFRVPKLISLIEKLEHAAGAATFAYTWNVDDNVVADDGIGTTARMERSATGARRFLIFMLLYPFIIKA